MKIKIITDFLNKEDSDELEKNIVNTSFPWALIPNTLDLNLPGYNAANHNPPFLRHTFFDSKNNNKTEHVVYLKKILERIQEEFYGKEVQYVRIASNCLLRNTEHLDKFSPPHIDVDHDDTDKTIYDCYTGLYYINDCDGETLMYDKIYEYSEEGFVYDPNEEYKIICRMMPKKGTFAYWNASMFHAGPASASKPRYVINFNFVVKK